MLPRELRKIVFQDRKDLGRRVPKDGDMKFPPVDELFDQDGGRETLEGVVHPLRQCVEVIDDGAGIDADARVFLRRLHDQRIMKTVTARKFRLRELSETRGRDSVRQEDLLCQSFSEAERKGEWLRAGVGN